MLLPCRSLVFPDNICFKLGSSLPDSHRPPHHVCRTSEPASAVGLKTESGDSNNESHVNDSSGSIVEIKKQPDEEQETEKFRLIIDSYLCFLTSHSITPQQLRMSTIDTPNPMKSTLPDPPPISLQTIFVTGLLVDVYGLNELTPQLSHVSVMWLHNPRLADRSSMAPLAKRAVAEYNATRGTSSRGLIAVAFDQRNHGSRQVHPLANQTWSNGNTTHAQDMLGIISGTVVDTRLLIDALPAYLLLDRTERPVFDQHICVGISLGGHSTWQTMFVEPRVTAGVSIIGCPDFQALMKDRARLSKLPTYEDSTHGASFLGSRDFPPGLLLQTAQFDPKAILFGTSDVPPPGTETLPLRQDLDSHVRGKKFLLCTGGDDLLVPWRCSEPFTRWFVNAAETWFKDGQLEVDNRIYPGKGHECSDEMVVDAIRFVVGEVNGAGTSGSVESRI